MKNMNKEKILDSIIMFVLIILAIILIELVIALPFIIKKDIKTSRYDVNNDGSIDARDYVAIRKYIMEVK